MTPLLTLLPFLAVAPAALAASYHLEPVPDTLTVAYPAGDVPLGTNISLGTNAPGADDWNTHALAWNTTLALTYPNGTHVDLGGAFWSGGCTPRASKRSDSTGEDQAAYQFIIDTGRVGQTGLFVVSWNQSYGTIPDVQPANATACDGSKLSYQSWLFSANFSVVPATGVAPTPSSKETTFALVPAPTGSMLVSNGARELRVAWMGIAGIVGMVVMQLL